MMKIYICASGQNIDIFTRPSYRSIPNMMISCDGHPVDAGHLGRPGHSGHSGHPGHPHNPGYPDVPVSQSVLQGRVYHHFGNFFVVKVWQLFEQNLG